MSFGLFHLLSVALSHHRPGQTALRSHFSEQFKRLLSFFQTFSCNLHVRLFHNLGKFRTIPENRQQGSIKEKNKKNGNRAKRSVSISKYSMSDNARNMISQATSHSRSPYDEAAPCSWDTCAHKNGMHQPRRVPLRPGMLSCCPHGPLP